MWVTVPEAINTLELMPKALENKVAYVPGTAFFPDGSGANTFRLNFSNANPENIEIGIRRLGKVLASELERIGEPTLAFA